MTDDLDPQVRLDMPETLPIWRFTTGYGYRPLIGTARYDRPCPLCREGIAEGDLMVNDREARVWICLVHYPDPVEVAEAVQAKREAMARRAPPPRPRKPKPPKPLPPWPICGRPTRKGDPCRMAVPEPGDACDIHQEATP